ncbi:hypothetical protein FJZ36_04495 [Candidatus Poribacteria bacterium]|nr:hypothetical protein [Candidatus Poribacteria bacterium]
MQVELLQARDGTLLDALRAALRWADSAYMAVAYGSVGAFALVRDDAQSFLRRNGRLRVLLDLDERLTDRQVVEEFATIPGDCTCKIHISPSGARSRGVFHPKLYLFRDDVRYCAILGSSNLTVGGLQHNIEANLAILANH